MEDIKIGRHYISRDLFFFIIASALLGVSSAVENSSFASKLANELQFTVSQRTMLEIPRELPGLCVVGLTALLGFLGDIRMAAVANIVGGAGLLLFGLVPSGYWPVVVTLIVYNTGTHLYMPLQSSISMSFASGNNMGRTMGSIQAVNTAALILTSAVLYCLYAFVHIPFVVSFTIGAVAMTLSGIMFFFINPRRTGPVSKQRFVFKKEYSLFYVLSIVYGARKQLTFTFVPWLIITVFDQPATTMTMLFFAVSVMNLFFRPLIGSLIDKKGPRFVLMLEASLLFFACFGFAFSKTLLPPAAGFVMVFICYVIDYLFVGAGMARIIYLRKIIQTPEDLSGTLSHGISVDHVVSMFMPPLAGILWATGGGAGYIYVFIGGAVISVLNITLASRIRIPAASSLESVH